MNGINNIWANKQKHVESECPEGCPVDEDWLPKIDPNCTCGKPLMIVIPYGKHIHPCKVHPNVILRGSDVYC